MCGTAEARRAEGRYSEAEPLYRSALELAEQVFGLYHPEVAVICNNLAVLYKYTGKFDEAERLYRRAFALMEQTIGSEDQNIATLYHNLGGLEHARGRFAAGEPPARRYRRTGGHSGRAGEI
jgi:tetratricopeptide (TPR) repeat protein